jgi:DNA-binding MarR family transcriptional regulator
MLTDFEYSQVIELLVLEDRSFEEVQEMLNLTDDQMDAALSKMEEDGYIQTHTIH